MYVSILGKRRVVSELEFLLPQIIAESRQGMSLERLVLAVIATKPHVRFSGQQLYLALRALERQRLIYLGANNRYYAV